MRLRFSKKARLRSSADFALLKREGKSFPGKYMVFSVLVAPGETPARLGVITSRRVGGAVQRNRVRRVVRELFRADRPGLRTGLSLVVIARQPSAGATFQDLRADWARLAQRAKLFAAPCFS